MYYFRALKTICDIELFLVTFQDAVHHKHQGKPPNSNDIAINILKMFKTTLSNFKITYVINK